MNCVGIDVSKGKSMIAVMRPFGEVVVSPFEVRHTASELSELARLLKNLDGETRVVMESTGNYHAPVAWLIHGAGFYVSVVNAMLVHDYGNNSLRRGKTDNKDAVKLANYGSEKWVDFVATFWHCECVCGLSKKAFTAEYQKWCRKHGYNAGHFSW